METLQVHLDRHDVPPKRMKRNTFPNFKRIIIDKFPWSLKIPQKDPILSEETELPTNQQTNHTKPPPQPVVSVAKALIKLNSSVEWEMNEIMSYMYLFHSSDVFWLNKNGTLKMGGCFILYGLDERKSFRLDGGENLESKLQAKTQNTHLLFQWFDFLWYCWWKKSCTSWGW